MELGTKKCEFKLQTQTYFSLLFTTKKTLALNANL